MATAETKRQETAAQQAARQVGQRGVDVDTNQSDGIGVFARAHNVPYEVLEAHIHATAMRFGLDPGQALSIAKMWGIPEFDRWLAAQGVPAEHRIGSLRVTPSGRGDAPPPPSRQERNRALARKLVENKPANERAMIDAMLRSR